MKKVNIRVEINTLDDILKLIDDYPIKHDTIYNIDEKLYIILNNLLPI